LGLKRERGKTKEHKDGEDYIMTSFVCCISHLLLLCLNEGE